jgi:hypothetical protein
MAASLDGTVMAKHGAIIFPPLWGLPAGRLSFAIKTH